MMAKDASTFIIVVTIALGTILLSVWGLLAYWNSQSQPSTYIVVNVERNTNDVKNGFSNGGCDDPYITVVRDPTTDQVSYKCGNLGKPSEIISLDE